MLGARRSPLGTIRSFDGSDGGADPARSAGWMRARGHPGDSSATRRQRRGAGPGHRGHRRPGGGAAAAPARVDRASPGGGSGGAGRAGPGRVPDRPSSATSSVSWSWRCSVGPVEPISYGVSARRRPARRRAVRLRAGRDRPGRGRHLRGDPPLVPPRAAAQAAGGRGHAVRPPRSSSSCSACRRASTSSPRLVDGPGSLELPAPLVVPIAAAFVFAIGTLVFLVEASPRRRRCTRSWR